MPILARFLGASAALAVLLGSAGAQTIAAEVEVRLVAADVRDRPPVSQLVDFRHSPDGGLIAIQWISGMKLGDRPLLPVTNRKASAPGSAELDTLTEKRRADAADDTAELLEEANQNGRGRTKLPPPPVDAVDPLYVGQILSDGFKVGPQRTRPSVAFVELKSPATITPGAQQVSPTAKRADVLCYRVTIAARSGGAAASFVPKLAWQGRDLLADCLFEHSPDLPLGDFDPATAPANSEARLAGSIGGQRPFRQLQIYLPALGAAEAPYQLNGQAFTLAADGVRLTAEAGRSNRAGGQSLRTIGKFALELVLPAAEDPAVLALPVLSQLEPGWQLVRDGKPVSLSQQSVEVPQSTESVSVTLQSPTAEQHIARTALAAPADQRAAWHTYVLLSPGAKSAPPVARTIAIAAAPQARRGTLRLRLSESGNLRSLPAKLIAWNGLVDAPRSSDDPPPTEFAVAFERNSAGEFVAPIEKFPAGLYQLRFDLDSSLSPAIPVVIAQAETRGAVSLATYHNRCDYLRGEQVHVAAIVRALDTFARIPAELALRHESGEERSLGQIELECAAGATASQFITLASGDLRLGRHELIIRAPGAIGYSLSFTVYSERPRTTFALYRWMVGSFSGPVRVGGEVISNLLFDQLPTQFLSPADLEHYTAQATLPEQFAPVLAADPFYPAVEKTITYDRQTERQMAVAMRLGLRYGPSYGWGMNSQEANWNPKHTLPEDLAHVARLCAQVTQRFRDFGNFAGLHLNWYPTIGGYWEQHPPTDGHAERRSAALASEIATVRQEASKQEPELGELELTVRGAKHRAGALPRAYDAWLEQARRLPAGMFDRRAAAALTSGEDQPGLSPSRPAYTSFLPVGWFQHDQFYPSVYHAALPLAGVHAYTDYGFSPFQSLWGIDYWAAGVRDKPIWATTMSNGRDVMLGQALLAAARGADGIDINGDDEAAARVVAQFLAAYGPLFRRLAPESDVAIVTSLGEQLAHGKRVGQWMGYNGGDYFDLYTKLWYARRPPAMLLEEEVTPERLRQFKGVFLVKQTELLPAPALTALRQYVKQGGHVFKDRETAAEYPGVLYDLAPPADDARSQWPVEHYQATRDRMFVATQASYESVAEPLAKLLARLGPPRVSTPTHHTLTAALAGKDLAIAVAVNDTHPWPGIEHPWNFWSATIMAAATELSFDRPYAVYDLLAGGAELTLERRGERYVLPITFERAGGRALALLPSPLEKLLLRTCPGTPGGAIPLEMEIVDRTGQTLQDPAPVELTVIDDRGVIVETIYRALGPGERCELTLPAGAPAGRWIVRARELFSGLTAQASIDKRAPAPAKLAASSVLIPRPEEVREFFQPSGATAEHRYLLLLDQPQVDRFGDELVALARRTVERLKGQGIQIDIEVVDPLRIVEVPQRWQPTQLDRRYLDEARAGERIVAAQSLATRYHRGEKQRDQPDYLHPWSGYGEPGARHRIHRHVILLGDPGTNRYLEDLHRTIGMRVSAGFPAPGAALAQIVFDAFVPEFHALSIQAHDLPGIERGVDAVVQLINARAPTAPPSASAPKLQTSEGATRTALPNPLQESFGAPVTPLAMLPGGGVLVSAGTQASNYFVFGPEGKLERKWLGNYSVQLAANQQVTWLRNWWGAPGYLDKIIRGDAVAEPRWMMDAPGYSGSFDGWRHPGTQSLVDPVGEDLLVSGHHHVARISPSGKVIWRYDDLHTSQDVVSFRFARDMMLHAISPDGKYLLVAAFGVEPYSRFVSRFVRPAVMLFDARSGQVLWEKSDIVVDHSACDFAGGGILVADATPGRKRLLHCDFSGKELWSLARPDGASRAAITADKAWLIAQPEAPRGVNHQVVGEPIGLQAIRLADHSVRQFPIDGRILDWRLLPGADRVLVSTADGQLRSFGVDGAPDWKLPVGGPCQFLVSADGRQIVVGTATGQLRWIDSAGKLLRKVDLMAHHVVRDSEAYVRDYTRSPREAPVLSPLPDQPAPLYERAAGSVKFSKNLLARAAALDTSAEQPLTESVTARLELAAGQTYLLSLQERSPRGIATAGEPLVVEVRMAGKPALVYRAELPISAAWQERTALWRATESGAAELTLRCPPPADGRAAGAELAKVGVFAVQYPSANVLADRVPLAPRDLAAGDGDAKTEGLLGTTGRATPPTIRYFLPNDVDLTAAARGAPPFKPVLEFTVPLDGRLLGQETSWMGRAITGSSHAQLQLTFKQPVTISAVCVHEDTIAAARYTDTYAVLARDLASGAWRQIGHVAGNRSPYNLFTCEPIETDAITYLWIRSADGHARVAEIEAYGPADDLLPAEQ